MDGHSGVYFIGLMWSHRKVAASSPRLRICYFAETEKDFVKAKTTSIFHFKCSVNKKFV